jgi:hypothetical protein
MNKLFRLNFLICLSLYCNTLAASELSGALSGIWKHDEQPVWVQISNQDHLISGVFLQHDVKPDLNGQLFIKEFSSDLNDPSLLAGLVYAARLKKFKAAEIEQNSADAFVLTATVKMGFIKRTVISNWSRSVGSPSEE